MLKPSLMGRSVEPELHTMLLSAPPANYRETKPSLRKPYERRQEEQANADLLKPLWGEQRAELSPVLPNFRLLPARAKGEASP